MEEALSSFSCFMMPESSFSIPGSGEGDASSASGDILTVPRIRRQHNGTLAHTTRCAQAGVSSTHVASCCAMPPVPALEAAIPVGWNRTTSRHDRNA